MTIEEKSLPKIPEEPSTATQSRQQRSLSVVIMQPIQLLPKYLRLNKSELDLTEDHAEDKGQLVVRDASPVNPAVSTTTQQEIWTMLQKERRYMERNIYVEEDEEGEGGDEQEIIVDGGVVGGERGSVEGGVGKVAGNKNKRLKSPTVAKPISVLLADKEHGGGGSLRLQLPKKVKKIKTDGGSESTDGSCDDEFINGSGSAGECTRYF